MLIVLNRKRYYSLGPRDRSGTDGDVERDCQLLIGRALWLAAGEDESLSEISELELYRIPAELVAVTLAS